MKKIYWVVIVAAIILLTGGLFYYFYYFQKSNTQNNQNASQKNNTDQFNVIIVGWDGVQRDQFFKCYNQELPECSNGLANIKELSSDKVYNLTVTNSATSTKPGWVQILSGYNGEITGTITNEDYATIPEGYTIFEKASAKYADLKTIFLAAKTDNLGSTCVGEKKSDGEVELKGEPWCILKSKISYFKNGLGKNEAVGDKTLEMISQYQNDRFLLFAQFIEPDASGHAYGSNSTEYSESIIDNDNWLGKINARLKELNLYQNTIIYVASDHGFDQNSKSHKNAPFTIYATNDTKVIRSGDRRDIAATILKRYEVGLAKNDSAPKVDGTPLDITPNECVNLGQSYLDYKGAPKCCQNLTLTNLDLVSADGTIIPATGGTGDNSGYCEK